MELATFVGSSNCGVSARYGNEGHGHTEHCGKRREGVEVEALVNGR